MANLDAHMEAAALMTGRPKVDVERVIKEWALTQPSVRGKLEPFAADNWAWQEMVMANVAKGKNTNKYEFKRFQSPPKEKGSKVKDGPKVTTLRNHVCISFAFSHSTSLQSVMAS